MGGENPNMQIAPGIHRVPTVTGSNAVLLVDEQIAVIDTGYPGNGETILAYLKDIGRSQKDLAWIITTHHHFDHTGTAAELHELTGAPVVAHEDETEAGPDGTPRLRKATERQHIPFWYRWLVQGFRPREIERPVIPDVPVQHIVKHGDVLPLLGGVHIMHTPGHTPGSICLLIEKPAALFLGDSAINNTSRISRPLMWDRGARRELDESLRSLRQIDANVALFGHGPALTEAVMPKIRALTDKPYDVPTWRIVLKNWRTLRRFYSANRRPGGLAGTG